MEGYNILYRLEGGTVLGNGLGALRDGVLGELTGEDETDRGLNLARRDGLTLVVASKTTRLGSDTLEDIGNEGVEDAHGLVGDTSIGVDLLEDLVDVARVAVVRLLSHVCVLQRQNE